MFATYSLRHSRICVHAPRRVSQVNCRRICPQSLVVMGSQGSGFVKQPSIFAVPCRAAPVASATELLQSCSASAAGAVLLHAAARHQALSLRLAQPLGRRHTQVALRSTTVSLPLATPRLAAQARLRKAVPNPVVSRANEATDLRRNAASRSCGFGGSGRLDF